MPLAILMLILGPFLAYMVSMPLAIIHSSTSHSYRSYGWLYPPILHTVLVLMVGSSIGNQYLTYVAQ